MHSHCEICTQHCQGCERNINLGGKGVAFGMANAAPFVSSLPAGKSRAPISLSRGGCDRRVVAASSIQQGVRGLHHGCSCLVVASTYCFSHGRQQVKRNIARQRSVSGDTPRGRCCLSFPMRTLGLRSCIMLNIFINYIHSS